MRRAIIGTEVCDVLKAALATLEAQGMLPREYHVRVDKLGEKWSVWLMPPRTAPDTHVTVIVSLGEYGLIPYQRRSF